MDVLQLIRQASSMHAADLQLVVGSPPLVRIYGLLQPMDNFKTLTPSDIEEAFAQLTTEQEKSSFEKEMELDFGYSIPDVVRVRCNAARQLNGMSLVLRLFPPKIPSIDELGLPEIYKNLVQEPRGLVLVCGPTDSGKSTTLAAMIRHLYTQGAHHVITVEDPIEYIHTEVVGAITQRQLGVHTTSYAHALKHILRQNPDVIMVGEIRDYETAASVLSLAEAGHLVLSTGHAPSAPQAIERIVDMFPLNERYLSQTRLASLLVAVLCQTLVPRSNGSGRIAAVEIMINNTPVSSLIREGKIHQLPNIIRTNHEAGMITLDEALVNLYKKGVITYQTALAYCEDAGEVGKLVEGPEKGKKYKSAVAAPAKRRTTTE